MSHRAHFVLKPIARVSALFIFDPFTGGQAQDK
jgi:hypothetical protein